MNIEKPYKVLGVTVDTPAEEVRQRYLHLVRQFPPDREPKRFHEIHAAYKACSEPLIRAEGLLTPPPAPQEWRDIIAEARKKPPRLPVQTLLGLGNRPKRQDKKPKATK